MKSSCFIFFTFFILGITNAQILENGKREIPVIIPLEDAPKTEASSDLLKLPIGKDKQQGSLLDKPKKQIDFTGQSKLVRRKIDFKPNYGTLNDHKREEYDAPKGNQFFGDFTNNGKFVRVYCRDHQAFDGDRISILVNDKLEIHDVLLTNSFKGFQIELKPGFNKVEFLALNQGESGPNTAEFSVLDENGNTISSAQWNLATGAKAHFVIVKNE
ncbi:hypothetical protein [Capnocytophaga canimorsus]|uniref:hypothetical protein n=1 Tax=Capnocytophaga canimorsus TaxID=28188 RepID=UPI000D6E7496|nr:hypothetical protein [Capnocytophaga canimorsus]AWL77629.1 hypothetical protein DKB58_00930 [Capnocytophaga canimorsus]AYW36179.1 hypothetical protein D8L92_01775 [Capnocytophaga canimorsus]MDT9498414.1 hypothetical protein [Capnocytophaga canimorsus]